VIYWISINGTILAVKLGTTKVINRMITNGEGKYMLDTLEL